jgi:hypothetical protein
MTKENDAVKAFLIAVKSQFLKLAKNKFMT